MSTTTYSRTSLADVAVRVNTDGVAATGRGATIALIDTGVAPNPLLDEANLVIGPDFSSEPEFAGRDTNGHGTHLAGIIATLAPGARLLSLRAGETAGQTHPMAVVNAIDWLVNDAPAEGLAADVLVLAYGVDPQAPEARMVEFAVRRAWDAGIAVVVAAGNTGQAGVQAPATDPRVIAVGGEAGTDTFELGDFSTRGDLVRELDVIAPGRSIVSARAIGAQADAENARGRVGAHKVAATGSSQSAAVVGAALALILEGHRLTNDQLKACLASSGRPVTGTRAGMLDVAQALEVAALEPTLELTPTVDADRANGTVLAPASWNGTRWQGASWWGVSWNGASWWGASWAGTRWQGVSWNGASWWGASWAGASWWGASWAGTRWQGVSWNGASWWGASWWGASWYGTRWQGASWWGASWYGTRWQGASWAGTRWQGVSWNGASWWGASWAGTRWQGVSWNGASWWGASWAGIRWA